MDRHNLPPDGTLARGWCEAKWRSPEIVVHPRQELCKFAIMDLNDRLICQRAAGYLDLGMPEEALAELDDASDVSPSLLHLRVEVLFRMQRWEEAATLCLPMLEIEPAEPAWWIQAAYAVRRSKSMAAAEPILQAALERHPSECLISYNLACYACVQGRHDEARELLARAAKADPAQVIRMAQNDPDLLGILPWILDRAAQIG